MPWPMISYPDTDEHQRTFDSLVCLTSNSPAPTFKHSVYLQRLHIEIRFQAHTMVVKVTSIVSPNVSIIPKGDIRKPGSDRKKYTPGAIDIWMLGVSIVLGGQYFGWNITLLAGVYSLVISTAIVGVAYTIFAWSMSEATGALPFAGGAYGLARCTLGFFPAYLVGCFQILQYIFSVSIAITLLMPMLISINPAFKGYELLLMFLCYAVTLVVQFRGGRIFWGVVWIFSIFGIGAICLYIFGNLPSVDFKTNAVPIPAVEYIGGVSGFFQGMPFTSWFFSGVEALNLASNDVQSPKKTIPRAQMACMAAMLITGVAVGMICISLPSPTGIMSLIGSLSPLNNGFMRVLKVDDAGATWISILPTYGVAFGFMWAYARLIKAMASSKLFPPVLAKVNRFGTPWLAHIVGSAIGYAVCVSITFYPIVIYFVFPITMAFSFLSYAGQCSAYILLRLQAPVMKQSTLKSPFGVPGAVFSLVVWIVCLVGVLWNGRVIMVVAPLTVAATAYYYAFARKRQTFSDEENKVLLTAHVSRFNANKRKVKPRSKVPAVNRGSAQANRGSAQDNTSGISQRNSVERRSVERHSNQTGNNFSVVPEEKLPNMSAVRAATANHTQSTAKTTSLAWTAPSTPTPQ